MGASTNKKSNQLKSIDNLKNIKSAYILQQIFDNIPIYKYLKIIQYNK